MAKAGMILMFTAIMVAHYFPEPMVLILGIFALGALFYALNK